MRGRGRGLNREGEGLINILPLKRGGLLERGGLIEDLRYFIEGGSAPSRSKNDKTSGPGCSNVG